MDFAIITIKKTNMNKQKFMHYVMLTFTYGIGVGTIGLLAFTLVTVFNNLNI